MPDRIEISGEVADALEALAGPAEDPDDVVRDLLRAAGHADLLDGDVPAAAASAGDGSGGAASAFRSGGAGSGSAGGSSTAGGPAAEGGGLTAEGSADTGDGADTGGGPSGGNGPNAEDSTAGPVYRGGGPAPAVDSADRKEQFMDLVRVNAGVSAVERVGRSAWRVETAEAERFVWIHYNADFEQFGGGASVGDALAEAGELVHVFLGPRQDQFYAVPDGAFTGERFTIYESDDGSWTFEADRGDPPNRRVLEADYDTILPIVG